MRRQPFLPLLIQQPVEDGAHRALLLPSPLDEFAEAVVQQMHFVVDFLRSVDPVTEYALRDELQEWEDIDWWSRSEGVDVGPDLQQMLDALHVGGVYCCRADSIHYNITSYFTQLRYTYTMLGRTYLC